VTGSLTVGVVKRHERLRRGVIYLGIALAGPAVGLSAHQISSVRKRDGETEREKYGTGLTSGWSKKSKLSKFPLHQEKSKSAHG
jgi:hypothetical protein